MSGHGETNKWTAITMKDAMTKKPECVDERGEVDVETCSQTIDGQRTPRCFEKRERNE